jgi:hypothetical protein
MSSDLEEELERVRGELEALQVKHDGMLDENERRMSEIEASFEKKTETLQRESKVLLEEVQVDCDQKIADLTGQLDKLRRAMGGDGNLKGVPRACGRAGGRARARVCI